MRAKTICTVGELTPPSRIAWTAHPHPLKMGTSATHLFELAPTGDGATSITQSSSLRQPKLLFAFFQRFMGVTSEKAHAQWQASLDNIKQILEEDPAEPRL